jgi:hypothetical protein
MKRKSVDKITAITLLLCLTAFTVCCKHTKNPQLRNSITDYPVDVFIGTGGIGYGIGSNPVTAQTPYGMCRVGPDTSPILRKRF